MEKLKEVNKHEAISEVLKMEEYKFVKGVEYDDSLITSKNFSDETKSAAFITEALANAVRCKICNARMHSNSITIDHIKRKEEGGIGNFGNAQLAHPYCNSTYKN